MLDEAKGGDLDKNHSVCDFARSVGGAAERLLKVKSLKLSLSASSPSDCLHFDRSCLSASADVVIVALHFPRHGDPIAF